MDVKNEIRIIGGRWRGRKLSFPSVKQLRPTPNRVRETVFNWLHYDIEGARCLDLYAGSGALGWEAASRGATRVVLVDSEPAVCTELHAHRKRLNATSVLCFLSEAIPYLQGASEPFDIVFLDPPFRQGLLLPVCTLLEAGGWLTARSKVYLESEWEWQPKGIPSSWRMVKQANAGEVVYRLYQRNSEAVT